MNDFSGPRWERSSWCRGMSWSSNANTTLRRERISHSEVRKALQLLQENVHEMLSMLIRERYPWKSSQCLLEKDIHKNAVYALQGKPSILKMFMFSGLSTQEEMCMGFIHYYPRQKLADCRSLPTPRTVLSAIGKAMDRQQWIWNKIKAMNRY